MQIPQEHGKYSNEVIRNKLLKYEKNKLQIDTIKIDLIFQYLHSLLFFSVGKNERLICVLRGALGQPRGMLSIVNQPFDWQLLSAEKYLQ